MKSQSLFDIALFVMTSLLIAAPAAVAQQAPTRLALFLVDGPAATSNAYPASGELTGEEICSATAVGSNSVLTAAHCVDNSKKAKIVLAGKSLDLTCKRHPDHKQAGQCAAPGDKECTADVALCKTAAKIDLGTAKYEVIQTDRTKVKKDMDIVMVGFGCTGDGKNDHGTLHVGKAKVARVSAEPPTYPVDALLLTKGGAVTCPGDSGAGNFDVEDATKRFVIAVSKQRMQTGTGAPEKTLSAMVQVSDKRVVDFMKKWGDDNSTKICGVHAGATGCR